MLNLPVLYKWNNKAWMAENLFTTWFTKYFKPSVETYYSENKILFKIPLLTDNTPGHPRAPMEMYNEVNVVFVSPNNIHFAPHESRNNFHFQVL